MKHEMLPSVPHIVWGVLHTSDIVLYYLYKQLSFVLQYKSYKF